MAVNLLDYDHDHLSVYCQTLGERGFRAAQLLRWVHRRGVSDFGEMSDLARSLRSKLAERAVVPAMQVLSRRAAGDGTIKWLFDVGNGDAVESVFIEDPGRGTLCISSQAGCPMGCLFCATGNQGFSRNLTTAEIIGQLRHVEHDLRSQFPDRDRAITNVVMMGMGEPLQNYRALVPALRLMLDDYAYGLSRRRVTVSTAGVIPKIDALAQECPVALAVSLHAPNDALRSELMPLNRKYPLSDLLDACQRYIPYAPRDFVTFEYCMLDGVNDQDQHANELVDLLRSRGHSWCKCNLIAFNPFAQSGLRASPPQRIEAFARTLSDAGIVTTIRRTRGDDIAAACGQLAGEVQDRTRAEQRMQRRHREFGQRSPGAQSRHPASIVRTAHHATP